MFPLAISSDIAIKDNIDKQEAKSNYDEGPAAPILAIRPDILTGLETETRTVYQIDHRRPKKTEWKSHTKKCHYMSDLIRLDNLGHCGLNGG